MFHRSSLLMRDPRVYQIAVLALLFAYGIFALDFEIVPEIVVAIAVFALGCQWASSAFTRSSGFEARSALISTLSLCLLLRTTSIPVAAFAAVVAIGSKFALRWNGKHIFNPTAFGLAATLACTDAAWVSAGQWGTAPVAGLWIAGLGSLVVRRARRSDVTWAFLAFHLALLFGRAWWLGDPPAIGLHAVSNGAFLIFAFYMISDPRTTPDSRAGRILFAAAVATLGLLIRFWMYEPNALLWSLVACAPLVPLLDRLLPGERHRWPQLPASTPTPTPTPTPTRTRTVGGHCDENPALAGLLPDVGAAA